MKLYVWYDKVKYEYLVTTVVPSPEFLADRFPDRDLIAKGYHELEDPDLERLAIRILKERGFIWMTEEIFEETMEVYNG